MSGDELKRIGVACEMAEWTVAQGWLAHHAPGTNDLLHRVGASCRALVAAVAELAASRENLLRQQAAMQNEVLVLRAERDAAGTDSKLASEEILALEAKNAALRALVGAPAPGAPQEPIR